MDKHGTGWLGSDSTNDLEHQALANMTSAVERRVEHMHELIEQSFADLRAGIRDDISAGFEKALRNVAKDSDFAKPFWQQGADHMIERVTAQGTQWVGRRILTWLVGTALVAAITWAVVTGRFK
jgi:hypothetical protein